MSNKNSAKAMRQILLKHGEELIMLLKDVAVNGKEGANDGMGFDGDLTSLQILVKQALPLMRVSDDVVVIPTNSDREDKIDILIELMERGDITAEQANAYSDVIKKCQDIKELDDMMVRIYQLENPK